MDLKMLMGETKAIFNKNTDKKEIKIGNKQIEILEDYIYLGKVGETKAIFNKNTDKKEIKIGNKQIEILEDYIYLGKVARIDEEMNVELNRRLFSGYNALRKHAEVLKGNLSLSLKRKVFNQCILPVIT